MTFVVTGLSPAPFAPLFALDDAALTAANAQRRIAVGGEPCRVSLEEARAGEKLLLVHHVSHDVATPFRSAYAIFVRRDATPPRHVDTLPTMIATRHVGLRGYDADGMLHDATLALPGEAQAAVERLLGDPAVARIDIHNAAHGCFLARVDRA